MSHPAPAPALTSRERVNRAMERRPHDRVPRHDTFWGDTLRRWAAEGLAGGAETALAALGSDFKCLSPFLWPSPFPGRDEAVSADANTRVFKDEWGATLRLFKDHQTTPEHLGWECDSPEAWHGTFRDRIAGTDSPIDFAPLHAAHARARQEDKWGFFTTVEPFECLRKLVGDVETMIAIKEDPDWIRDMAAVTTGRTLRDLGRLWDAGLRPDGLWIYGDMAYNHATLCSPADYKALVWPEHKRLCDWAHERGLKAIFHTDGNVNAVIDLYVAAGVDCLQPLECKAGMDIRALVPSHGDRLSFFGNIDVMVMIRGDLDAIEAEIRAKFAAGKAANGYLYHSDHSIPPQVGWPLYQDIIRLVERHGSYT